VAFAHAGLDWRKYVAVDPKFYRPAEVDVLIADPTRARADLAWRPAVSFESLVKMMVDADLGRLRPK
jgi:GDPmannose 4,6-dehydratase